MRVDIQDPNIHAVCNSSIKNDHHMERIMTDALEDHEGTVSIGGRTITNLRFADDIDDLAGEEEELANLVERLDKASTAYGILVWSVSSDESGSPVWMQAAYSVRNCQASQWDHRIYFPLKRSES